MNPYQKLGENAFWATAVARHNMFDISGLWDPKFAISKSDLVATFGSCFAQHIGRALAKNGYNWLDTEPPPRGLSPEKAAQFNFGVFTARTGNIYTVSLLRQWVGWAAGDSPVPDEVWEKNGRYYDCFRPNIEPDGFASHDEMRRSRAAAIRAFRTAIESADVFVFTLGLTESWSNSAGAYEYPMCPGTAAGVFDAARHQFVNQDYAFIRATLSETIARIRGLNGDIRFLLTVSPVPLTATMSGRHVLVATMESKSILRAVAGSMAREFPFVDYFPSYEIINGAPFRGTFFEANQRNVNHAGVAHVMSQFFSCLAAKFPAGEAAPAGKDSGQAGDRPRAGLRRRWQDNDELQARRQRRRGARDGDVCEEELLEAFSPPAAAAS